MKDDFETNLPWYVNGTLDPEERADMERYLAEHPDAVAKLDWYREFSEHVRKAWKPDVIEVSGLERMLRAIHASAQPAGPSLWEKIWATLDGIGITPRVAGAAAIVVITLQAGLIGVMQRQLSDIESVQTENRSTAVNAKIGPFIRISFRPDTKEFDIRMLFVGLGATYVGGPSQLGDYYVYVPREYIDQVVVQLRSSQHVETAALVAKVPPFK